ncbi:MAG: CCA tRNA nucleotidyltransferase, partial [uncultured Rubrobacteraceae bacterium]
DGGRENRRARTARAARGGVRGEGARAVPRRRVRPGHAARGREQEGRRRDDGGEAAGDQGRPQAARRASVDDGGAVRHDRGEGRRLRRGGHHLPERPVHRGEPPPGGDVRRGPTRGPRAARLHHQRHRRRCRERRDTRPVRRQEGPRVGDYPGRRRAPRQDARRSAPDAPGRPLRDDAYDAGEAVRDHPRAGDGHPGERRLAGEHKRRADKGGVREDPRLPERVEGAARPRQARPDAVHRPGVHGDPCRRAGGRVPPQGRLRAHPHSGLEHRAGRGSERLAVLDPPEGGLLPRYRQAPHARLRAPLHVLRPQEHAEDGGRGGVRALRRAHAAQEDPLLRPRERRRAHRAQGHEAPRLPEGRRRRRRPPRLPPHAPDGLRRRPRPVERLGGQALRPRHVPGARRARARQHRHAPQARPRRHNRQRPEAAPHRSGVLGEPQGARRRGAGRGRHREARKPPRRQPAHADLRAWAGALDQTHKRPPRRRGDRGPSRQGRRRESDGDRQGLRRGARHLRGGI